VTDSPKVQQGEQVIQQSEDVRWQSVMTRDAGQDGRFVYGVSSTGIYCRPSCPSRRPARSRVRFFGSPIEAESAGFRACLRCRPADPMDAGMLQVKRAREYLERHAGETVTLKQLGAVAQMSPFHLQRKFKRVVGLSPKAYASALRMERMKSGLRQGDTVSRATYDAGYGSGSRAYEHARSSLGMTPGVYRRGGRGLRISFTVVRSPVGHLLAAATDRGLCSVMLGDDASDLERRLREEFPEARLERDDAALKLYADQVLARLDGERDTALALDIPGTDFQHQVWDALKRIPAGETRSYQAIAREVGRPTAARAVAAACASNRLALVIPCHRAIREHGETGGYRWGAERKRTILERERSQRDSRKDQSVPA
jgi:AraC family transcriptional regulator, regulatory protein of adaptative response / methylated-DNA-[protein]-cysteine methyltransferase